MQKKKSVIISLILASILLASFFAILILVVNKYNFKIDLFNAEIVKARTPFWNKFFEYFSIVGNFYFLLGLMIVLVTFIMFKYKQKFASMFVALSFAFVSVINFLIKNVVKRVRPEQFMLFKEFSYSFPSWHAMLTCFVFGVLIYFALKYLKNKPLKITLIIIFSTIILLMGFARVYLGVHYLSDVLAGLMLGFAFVLLFVVLYNKCFATKKD